MTEAIIELIGNGGYIGILLGAVAILFVVMVKSVKFSVLTSSDSANLADKLLNFIRLLFLFGLIGTLSLEAFKVYDQSEINGRNLTKLENELLDKEKWLSEYEQKLKSEANRQELLYDELNSGQYSIPDKKHELMINLLSNSVFPSLKDGYESKSVLNLGNMYTDFKTGIRVLVNKIQNGSVSLTVGLKYSKDQPQNIEYEFNSNSLEISLGREVYNMKFERKNSSSVLLQLIQIK